ncbi:hypothetical protein DLM85_07955 [Hymenobacter edaphi]|uniref:Uncharacterized protein n=1 Tax=Hymenobacter edaphi TaxID=2211146 RepID=A0A328BLX7_9BACT|nr:hypothetical protein DLM85_07955 [Hymenobacter edaphi]
MVRDQKLEIWSDKDLRKGERWRDRTMATRMRTTRRLMATTQSTAATTRRLMATYWSSVDCHRMLALCPGRAPLQSRLYCLACAVVGTAKRGGREPRPGGCPRKRRRPTRRETWSGGGWGLPGRC